MFQYWFWQWLGAVRQQAITRTDVDHDPWHLKSLQGYNELIPAIYHFNNKWKFWLACLIEESKGYIVVYAPRANC